MTDHNLPAVDDIRRPRWRPEVPALWRGESSVQFGDDVVVNGIRPEHITWLSSLDGARTSDDIAASLPIDRADAQRLLSALVAAGGIVDAARMPDVARTAGHGRAEIMRDLDTAVDTYRELPKAFAAIANRATTRIAVVGGGGVATAVLAAAADAHIPTVADIDAADIVILTDGHHPDVPAQLEPGLDHCLYLHVGVGPARAVVGPLVATGVTSCLRCAHLHRNDADSAWPILAVQLAQSARGLPQRAIDPLLARAAAVHALLLVRACIDAPHDLAAWANSAIEIRLPGPSATLVGRPPHPLCGCRWSVG